MYVDKDWHEGCIPRLYAAASLKHDREGNHGACISMYSAALCRGLIEASMRHATIQVAPPYSAALCRGLIEARIRFSPYLLRTHRIPRLYAAASLKPVIAVLEQLGDVRIPRLYAAASLKHRNDGVEDVLDVRRIPRLYAAASLKRRMRNRG